MIGSAEDNITQWLKALKQPESGGELEVSSLLSQVTLDIIGRAAFGANIGHGTAAAAEISGAALRNYIRLIDTDGHTRGLPHDPLLQVNAICKDSAGAS